MILDGPNFNHRNQFTIRGILLGLTIDIERKMDDYIATYFCDSLEKKNELQEYLLFTDKISLEAKRQIFVLIIKKQNPKFLKRHPKFLSELESIIPHRNVFAHLELEKLDDIEAPGNADMIFKKYSLGKYTPKVYASIEVTMILVKMYNLEKQLKDLKQGTPPLA